MTQSAFEQAKHEVSNGADPREQARGLISQMSLDEKLDCLDGDMPFWPGLMDMVSGGYWDHPWPAAKNERLGIPGLDFADGPRGCVIGPCTSFPVTMARGASFDPSLEKRVGVAMGAELRASGATYTGAVCMNLLRHPAWGRAQETYGEDPLHVGAMAEALTEGLQRHVMACLKHFALNSMENTRFIADITADERALHEVYLPHFKRVAQAGVASVMSAYNSLNGAWCGDSKALLKDILRDEWGYDGFVITDFIYGLRDPVKSVQAGCNVEMPFRQQRAVALADAIESGELSEADVEARVEETLATFLRFAHVYDEVPSRDVIACKEHRELAREAAVASMVLLRNESELLPLKADTLGTVAVLGPLAAVPNLGDGGSSNVLQPDVTTPLAGLQSALPHAEVRHADRDVNIAKGADVVLVLVGYTEADEGEYIGEDSSGKLVELHPPTDHPATGFPADYQKPERSGAAAGKAFATGGDRLSLRLHPEDETLIREVSEQHDRVIVAVMAGSAVVMPWFHEVEAVLMLWYPGMEGGHALADVLLGHAEPGGRLPFAVPAEENQLVHFDRDATHETYGLLHGQWWLDSRGIEPLLPFGYGLGYTRFALEGAKLHGEEVGVDVVNCGSRRGKTVVQVYGGVKGSSHERPTRRLVGFLAVELDAGERIAVSVPIDMGTLDLRIDGSWLREDLPVTYSVGLHAGQVRPIA